MWLRLKANLLALLLVASLHGAIASSMIQAVLQAAEGTDNDAKPTSFLRKSSSSLEEDAHRIESYVDEADDEDDFGDDEEDENDIESDWIGNFTNGMSRFQEITIP